MPRAYIYPEIIGSAILDNVHTFLFIILLCSKQANKLPQTIWYDTKSFFIYYLMLGQLESSITTKDQS